VKIAYRLRQLVANLRARPLAEDARREVADLLSEREQALFYGYTYADQAHAIRVIHCLRDAGYNHPDLLTAALLHDTGKIRCPLSVWDRTIIVVGSALFPRRAIEWGNGSLDSRRRPFIARARHPQWGAEMAAAAGSRPAVIDLIRRHQDKHDSVDNENDRLLVQLQWADDQS